jgi:hypothetical protein
VVELAPPVPSVADPKVEPLDAVIEEPPVVAPALTLLEGPETVTGSPPLAVAAPLPFTVEPSVTVEIPLTDTDPLTVMSPAAVVTAVAVPAPVVLPLPAAWLRELCAPAAPTE